ncbi:MAG: hypothetical protein IKB98_08020 [Clostridia bacterium]|nr:hypothetical protein [Clostridia bacterium]
MEIKVKCSVCGKKSEQSFLTSTNQFGSPDLDFRPAQMARSTMLMWLQECPNCGFVAKKLSDKTKITKEFLLDKQYLYCDNRNFISELAEMFYRHYLISIFNNENEAAFYSLLHAAWASDDSEDNDNAIYCRKKAIIQLSKFVDEEKKEELMVVCADLLRRSGQFDLLVTEYQGKNFSSELFNKIITFQIEKAKEKDTTCYTINDIFVSF